MFRDIVSWAGWYCEVGPGVPAHTVNECRELGSINPLILDFGTTDKWGISYGLRPFHPKRNNCR